MINQRPTNDIVANVRPDAVAATRDDDDDVDGDESPQQG
jgi:hypothetical protein